MAINQDTVSGKIKEVKGQLREKWGELTNDPKDVVQGNAEQLAGKTQQAYGSAKENLKEGLIETVETIKNKGKQLAQDEKQTPAELPPARPEPPVVDPQAQSRDQH